jgi:hypothetical protein
VLSAFYASVSLVDVQFPPPTTTPSERLDQLNELVNEGLVNLWAFAGEKLDMAVVGAEVVPLIVSRLGVSSVRFLKVRFYYYILSFSRLLCVAWMIY